MIEPVLLALQLSKVSPYAARIEPIINRVPEIMENNDQLRPLWDHWRRQALANVPVKKCFTRQEIKILRYFFEYLYFSSDAFIRSVGERL